MFVILLVISVLVLLVLVCVLMVLAMLTAVLILAATAMEFANPEKAAHAEIAMAKKMTV